jgi:protocatechuate 3,4-dioxygenase beta subunit
MLPTRRSILQGWLASSAAGLTLVALPSAAQAQQGSLLPPTPSCGAQEPPTLSSTAGPFYTPNTPVKRNFRNDARGENLTLAGFVVDRRCRPIAGALVDLWHADASGEYDNKGFRLRGHQLTDERGRYVFETIVPARYTGRTRHYHVKVQPRGGRVLTTQLYFPNESGNERDFLFNRRLLLQVETAADGKVGRFDFVLEV